MSVGSNLTGPSGPSTERALVPLECLCTWLGWWARAGTLHCGADKSMAEMRK